MLKYKEKIESVELVQEACVAIDYSYSCNKLFLSLYADG
jgi:hypothetical protein